MINRAKLAAILAGNKRKVRGISANKAVEIQYRKTLLSLVKEIGAFNLSFIESLTGIKDSNFTDYDSAFNAKFSKRLDKLAEDYPKKFLGKADTAHKKAFISEINTKIGVNLTSILRDNSNRVGRVVTNRIKENSDLIVSLAGDFKQQARDAIHETLINGDDRETLRAKLEHIEGVTESRAELIARDQTQKVCTELNSARQQDVGIKYFYWRGIDDGRERDSHVELNNQRFSWDNPPEEIEDINCRCSQDPDLEGFLENQLNE